MKITKEDVRKLVSPLQLCADQQAGTKAIFESNEIEAILVIDAENAFKFGNQNLQLHSVKRYTCTYATLLPQDCSSLIEENYDHKREQPEVIQQQ